MFENDERNALPESSVALDPGREYGVSGHSSNETPVELRLEDELDRELSDCDAFKREPFCIRCGGIDRGQDATVANGGRLRARRLESCGSVKWVSSAA